MYNPMTSRVFSAKCGSVDTLKCRTLCGASRWRTRILCTVVGERPTFSARARTVQCVSPSGAELRASSATSRTFASDVRGFPGGRVLSRRRPSTPSRMNRSCQRHTVAFAEPVSAITAIVPKPSSAGGTIRARRACFTLLLPPPAIASSRLRCSSETSKSTPVRIVPPLVCPALSPRGS